MSDLSHKFQVFRVDQMYYSAALDLIDEARPLQVELDSLQAVLRESEEYRRASPLGHGDIEINRAVANAEQGFDETFPTVLSNLATALILLASAAEAHINHAAKQLLSGSQFDHFDRLPADGKWLFLPSLLGVGGFDTGKNPFQDFARLVGFRNRLIHYRSRKEPLEKLGVLQTPTYLESLGLTLPLVQRSADAVRGMFAELRSRVKDPYTTNFWVSRVYPFQFFRRISDDGSDAIGDKELNDYPF